MQTDRFFLMLEGNIGSGKSTFLQILNKHLPNINIVPEPVHQWQTLENDENLLDLFYKDMPRWAYTFQTFAFISRVKTLIAHEKYSNAEFHCVERSVYCDRYCFAKNCFEQGVMTELEWFLYKDLFSWLVKNYAPKPAGFIYLRTDPIVSQQRISLRNRSEESAIPLSYLEALHKQHESWLIEKENIDSDITNTPILVLDCNTDFEHNEAIQKKHIEAVESFLWEIKSSGKGVTTIPNNTESFVDKKTLTT